MSAAEKRAEGLRQVSKMPCSFSDPIKRSKTSCFPGWKYRLDLILNCKDWLHVDVAGHGEDGGRPRQEPPPSYAEGKLSLYGKMLRYSSHTSRSSTMVCYACQLRCNCNLAMPHFGLICCRPYCHQSAASIVFLILVFSLTFPFTFLVYPPSLQLQ